MKDIQDSDAVPQPLPRPTCGLLSTTTLLSMLMAARSASWLGGLAAFILAGAAEGMPYGVVTANN
jgi:hypothetical protein